MTVWKEFVVSRRLHPLSPWPSNSPDLNPIENVFGWMKKFVENEGPTSEATLKVAVKKAFKAIPDNHLAHLMDSIPKRLELTLQRKGARINYWSICRVVFAYAENKNIQIREGPRIW
jgi:transposase